MHQKAAVESVHFPLWTYNPTTGKVKLDSADKSDTVSFAYPPLGGGSRSARTHPKRKRGRANAVSKELGENRFKKLVKKIGQDKAMEMLKGAPLATCFASGLRPVDMRPASRRTTRTS